MNKHGLDQYLRRLTPAEEEQLSGPLCGTL